MCSGVTGTWKHYHISLGARAPPAAFPAALVSRDDRQVEVTYTVLSAQQGRGLGTRSTVGAVRCQAGVNTVVVVTVFAITDQ